MGMSEGQLQDIRGGTMGTLEDEHLYRFTQTVYIYFTNPEEYIGFHNQQLIMFHYM